MPKLVVLDGLTLNPGDNPWAELEAIGELTVYDRTPPELVVERATGAEIVFTNKTALVAEAIASLSTLRGICVLATGVNVVDTRAARARGIPVCNVPAYSTASVAQHTMALVLELANAVGLHDRAVHAGEWANSSDFSFWKAPILELEGLVLGIVGYGTIGRRVAAIARSLGMEVRASASNRVTVDDDVERLPLDRLFAAADVLSLHCPLVPETERLVRRERLATMKRSALLVNTGRGGLVDEKDLAEALERGVIRGAAVDVLSSEPPDAGNPLLHAPRCIVTPHIAWTSLPARQRVLQISAENARAVLNGKPIHVVNT